ncbi:hypothetical protein J3R30DRAFT_3295679, partial [Lentinula aciculospora]
ILFATTDKYYLLDSASHRSGRMDVHIEYKLASRYQAKELFLRFYDPGHDLETVEDNDNNSGDPISSVEFGYASLDNVLERMKLTKTPSAFHGNELWIQKLR